MCFWEILARASVLRSRLSIRCWSFSCVSLSAVHLGLMVNGAISFVIFVNLDAKPDESLKIYYLRGVLPKLNLFRTRVKSLLGSVRNLRKNFERVSFWWAETRRTNAFSCMHLFRTNSTENLSRMPFMCCFEGSGGIRQPGWWVSSFSLKMILNLS